MNAQEPQGKLDQVLLERDTLLPSSGFAASVMEAILREAAAPPPIPFPWKRAIPGLAALLVGMALLIRLTAATVSSFRESPADPAEWLSWLQSNAEAAVVLRSQAAPAIVAIALSWLCVLLCRRLVGGSPAQ
jgi:hypothetical protein